MSQKDNLSNVLEQAIRNRLAELQTAAPGQVVSYDYKTQKASVQPTINRKYKDGQVSPYPVINNVPVIFPRSGGASMTFPVKPGDTVLLVFAARSIDDWLQRGGKVDQSDTRMHSINDAIAIPGLLPFSAGSKAKNNEDVLVTYKQAEIEIKPDSQINMHSPLRIKMDTPEVRMTGNLVVEQDIYDQDTEYGSFGAFRTLYNTHTHDENDNAPAPTDVTNHPWGAGLGDPYEYGG